ncbi:MAG: molybdopterin-synthase adenylyltransferase MoeB [Alphaproteobacteria bacterium]|nr:molybdopterin-synthase adenylyltransferase MoeB [Alphaproteobacteria bacterium]
MDLRDDQIERYARHIILKEVGGPGQARLLNARVLVIGAGGLGSPLVMYLAAAGVGTIGVVDFDEVSLSNLQRQILHITERVGMPKTESAQLAVKALNPDVNLVAHTERLTAANAMALVSQYDVVADGSDNFATRFLVNDAAFFAKKTLVSGALSQFDGQIAMFRAHKPGDNPCYRCIYREPPPPGLAPSCAEAGILGALAGVVGSLQAVEVLKEIVGIGESLSGKLVIYDALNAAWRTVKVRRDAKCALCGPTPIIKNLSQSLIGHPQPGEEFCEVPAA